MGKALVFRGSYERTTSGLKRDSLMNNKRGKVVSKLGSAAGKRRYKQVKYWIDAVVAARKFLNLSGFVAVNGKTAAGKALYVKAKSMCASKPGSPANLASGSAAASGTPSKAP